MFIECDLLMQITTLFFIIPPASLSVLFDRRSRRRLSFSPSLSLSYFIHNYFSFAFGNNLFIFLLLSVLLNPKSIKTMRIESVGSEQSDGTKMEHTRGHSRGHVIWWVRRWHWHCDNIWSLIFHLHSIWPQHHLINLLTLFGVFQHSHMQLWVLSTQMCASFDQWEYICLLANASNGLI